MLKVITGVQPSIQRPTSTEQLSLNALDNGTNLLKGIVAETMERVKAKKIAAEEARQKLSTNLLEMLEKLENAIHGFGSQDEVQTIAATHEELKRKQHLVKDQMAMQVQSKMSQGPRIAVFYTWRQEDGKRKRELLTSLRADMVGVGIVLLCEKPGQEHTIPRTARKFNRELGEERAEKLQPLLASGLNVVRRVLSTLEPHELESGLGSVTVPCLDGEWDLRAMEAYGNRSMDLCEDTEKVDALNQAEDSASEWFLKYLENKGCSMLKTYGVQRVRYRITSGEDEFPKHRRGEVAWICRDHVSSGLKYGMLELFPLKYYNAEEDHQLRLPHVRFNE